MTWTVVAKMPRKKTVHFYFPNGVSIYNSKIPQPLPPLITHHHIRGQQPSVDFKWNDSVYGICSTGIISNQPFVNSTTFTYGKKCTALLITYDSIYTWFESTFFRNWIRKGDWRNERIAWRLQSMITGRLVIKGGDFRCVQRNGID